jgi:hypothetical protein
VSAPTESALATARRQSVVSPDATQLADASSAA